MAKAAKKADDTIRRGYNDYGKLSEELRLKLFPTNPPLTLKQLKALKIKKQHEKNR